MDTLLFTSFLQPLTATTPLAALLNRWLLALAPAAALINPRRPSAARECLQNTTAGAHFFHALVVKLIERLEAGKDLKPLLRFVQRSRPRPSLSHPIDDLLPAYALALRGSELRTAQQVYKMVGYTNPHLEKLLAQPSPFTADHAQLVVVLHGGQRAAFELFEVDTNDPQVRADTLAILRAVRDADVEGLAATLSAIEKRHYPQRARRNNSSQTQSTT
jgi:hypothetical protein